MTKIKSVQALKELNQNNTYLLLISPESIPHLVLVDKGKYYSLTNRKSVIGEDFKSYFEFLKRSKRKVLFIELSVDATEIESNFKKYQKVNSGDITCLQPIKDWLNAPEEIQFVFALIPWLQENNIIMNSYHLHMEDILDNLGDFKLSEYTKEDIYSYIDRLNKKYV